MFESNSRYYLVGDATYEISAADGSPRQVVYKRRRFLPAELSPLLTEHVVADGDRLDNLSARYLHDPAQSFRICDENFALHPRELCATVGSAIRIGLIVKAR